MTYIRHFISFFNYFCMAYTIILSLIYIFQLVTSFFKIRKNNRIKQASDIERYLDSDNILPVSLLIPAYNEEDNIVDNVKSLAEIDYPEFELIVVNDGSKDETHERMIEAFDLYPIETSYKISIPTKKIRNIYYNPEFPNLIYVDKENGGKADALNAGINISTYPLFVCLDADSRIEQDALLKLSNEFLKDTSIVVAGGLVRIANGSTIRNGKWYGFEIPEKIVERFQIVEYFRSFLSGRVSWGLTNSMLIVSGAFGIFKKSTVVEVGGYKTDTIGEDMEIVVRIHRHMLETKEKYRICFIEDAVCWTQGPMSLNDIRSQRRRWQIGLIDSLWSHRALFLNPRYKAVGLFSIPYNWAFEFLGAIVEALGCFIIPFSLLVGELKIFFFVLYIFIASLLGIIMSVGGLILEQYTRKGSMTASQCLKLSIYAVLENFGYRQLITLYRVEGIVKYKKLKGTWGQIKRKAM